jgi:hypothetical protein
MGVRAAFKNGNIYLIDRKIEQQNPMQPNKKHLITTGERKDEGSEDSLLTHMDSS